ncbi:glycosyltransferase [Leptolyngbya sp. FACHB-17]|uniref:glycosyltransferase family protein n=1 Tax=unclassified Leptolyngbya TaxID=2650499 RepID=UPI0016805EA5|nr:glycosyltransferase family 1 protein [Leptolyngbya sp. FACHB-17]
MNFVVENKLSHPASEQQSRVCLLSARNVRDRVTDAMIYEIEDLISDFDQADLLTYDRAPDRSRRMYTAAYKITRSRRLSQWITPAFNAVQTLEQDYDLFFVVLRNIFELQALKSLKNWRSRCKTAICFITESWPNDEWLHKRRHLLEPLKQFDAILMGSTNSVEPMSYYTRRPCTWMPFGLDTLKFSPSLGLPKRSIDLASLGRRSEITHAALLELSQSANFFYYYDTGSNLRTMVPQEHRSMYANLLKRSRYFITNYACADEPDKSSSAQEIGYRFYEGAAAGTIMIGCAPQSKEFQQLFDWPDAVIPMPFHAPDIAQFLAELEAQPDRLNQIHVNNAAHALQKHDWVYRWEKILATVGLPPTPQMQHRKAQLHQLSQAMLEQTNRASQPATPVRAGR